MKSASWKTNYRGALLTLLAMCGFAAQAQQGNEYTFERLVKDVFRQNLDLRIQNQQTRSDMTDEDVAKSRLLPSLSLTSGRSQTLQNLTNPNDEEISYSSNLQLSQPVYDPALWESWKKAQLSSERSRHSLEKQRQSLMFQVKSAWYNLLAEQVLNAEAHASLERLQQHKKNAEAFYRSGKIWRNDVLQAHVRVSRGEQDVFAANNRLTLAKSLLNQMLNRKVTLPFNPKGMLDRVPFERPFNGLVKLAMSNRLELKQSKIDVKLAEKDVVIAEAGLYPTVNLRVSTGLTSESFHYREKSMETTASLNLSWNLWQWGETSRKIDAAEADLTVSKYNLQQQKTAVLLEVQRAYLTVMESQKSLNVSETGAQASRREFQGQSNSLQRTAGQLKRSARRPGFVDPNQNLPGLGFGPLPHRHRGVGACHWSAGAGALTHYPTSPSRVRSAHPTIETE